MSLLMFLFHLLFLQSFHRQDHHVLQSQRELIYHLIRWLRFYPQHFVSPVSRQCPLRGVRKLRARNYDGVGDPEKAWSWLEGNERVFSVMGCSDEQMVTYCAFLLRDRALDWCKAVQRQFPEGVSWTQFKEEFL